MNQLEHLYFGTWQLGGQFKTLSPAYIESLLLFAVGAGINRFDTAAVYGGGRVEEMLGRYLPKDSVIVTKVPAASKPDFGSPAPIERFYSRDGIRRSVFGSLERLRRTSVDTVLLHNWLPAWASEAIPFLEHLIELKEQHIVNRIGISLPDDFSSPIDGSVLPFIDVVEAPFNSEQQWILQQIHHLLDFKKEVLLRSLFRRGRLLIDRHSAEALTREALRLGSSAVIGMTTEEHIAQNIHCLKEWSHELKT